MEMKMTFGKTAALLVGLVLGPAWGVPAGVLHVGGPFTASPPQIRPPFQTTRPTTSTSAIATSTGS